MGKKKNRESKLESQILAKCYGRKINFKDRAIFLHRPRKHTCLYQPGWMYLEVNKLDRNNIRNVLEFQCSTIEHQIIALRECTQLTTREYQQRHWFTRLFLECLYKHHNIFYQGILFGSTVNGLGFRDSDVDLRLRPLKHVGGGIYEPIAMDDEMVDKTLRNIAFQTTKCCPALGDYVPSSRCPVAKLTFLRGKDKDNTHLRALQEGLKYDVSLSSSNPLGTFNSMFLRFLCHLEPKFHLLATILRYWSNIHELIVPGYLSSYALVNMLIHFCQIVEPPLLPSIDQMRDLHFEHTPNDDLSRRMEDCKKGVTQLEWHCIVCLRKEFYSPSKNTEPLSVLLLNFFEIYLNFPYSTHIITTRPGRSLDHEEFKKSTQFHPRFPINTFLNIQDPFDLKHNLTSGMQGGHFRLFMTTMRYSYERLYKELMDNFCSPNFPTLSMSDPRNHRSSKQSDKKDYRDWGLNTLFVKLTDQELKDAT